jgi:hypothetical protein
MLDSETLSCAFIRFVWDVLGRNVLTLARSEFAATQLITLLVRAHRAVMPLAFANIADWLIGPYHPETFAQVCDFVILYLRQGDATGQLCDVLQLLTNAKTYCPAAEVPDNLVQLFDLAMQCAADVADPSVLALLSDVDFLELWVSIAEQSPNFARIVPWMQLTASPLAISGALQKLLGNAVVFESSLDFETLGIMAFEGFCHAFSAMLFEAEKKQKGAL